MLSVIMVTQGAKRFECQRDAVTLRRGELAIANPGEIHGCNALDGDPWAHQTWYLSRDLLRQLSDELGYASVPEIDAPHITDANLVQQVARAHGAQQSADALASEGATLSALSILFERHGSAVATQSMQTKGDAAARMAIYRDYIHDEIGGRIALNDLAAAAQVTRFQVIRDVKRVAHLTPGQYVRLARLQYAKDLLVGGASLSAAASEAGFYDQSHFNKVFRQVYGLSPTAFLAALGRSSYARELCGSVHEAR